MFEIDKSLFFGEEEEVSEIELLLRDNPLAAKRFVEMNAKGELNWEDLTMAERNLLINVCIEANIVSSEYSPTIKALREVDYIRTPASPEDFLNDPKYLGPVANMVYPKWKEELAYVLNPKNEIHEFILSGSIGCGKCLAYNSFIRTSEGLLHFDELYNLKKFTNKVEAESGIKEIKDYHNEGITDTIKINTKLGFELEGRPNHKIRIFTGKEIIWKELQEVIEGDIPIILRGKNFWGKNLENISLEQAELWGVIIGDGCIKKGQNKLYNAITIAFGSGEDEQDYLNKVVLLVQKLGLNHKVSHLVKNNGLKFSSLTLNNNNGLIQKWADLGLVGRSWEKKVPLSIRMGTKEVVSSFIRGLFDTDGTVYEKGNSIEFSTVSNELSIDIQQLLLNFGIVSSRYYKKNKYRGSWTVRLIGKESKEIFAKEIGFNHRKKAARLIECIERKNTTWRHNDNEIIPIDLEIVSSLRDSVRYEGLKLKENSGMFVFVYSAGKQNFTYKALNKIVEHFGQEYLPSILKQIYNEHYIFDTISLVQKSKEHCYDITVYDDPSYISNGFISHNTYTAIVAQLYKLHVLSCLKNIPAYFGLSQSTSIYFAMFTLSLGKAEAALAKDFREIIGMSPYFKNVFPQKKTRNLKKMLNTQGDNRTSELYDVVLPKGLDMLMGSKVNHALSVAVISAILDEMNFRTKRTITSEEDPDSAEAVYNQIKKRLKSRFERLGSTPGILCVISSKKATDDFMEAHISKVKDDPHTHISSYAIWETKPWDYAKERFHVFLGSSASGSRILTKEEVEKYPKNSPKILSVPMNLFTDFKYDINSALRELAGIATSGSNLLFDDPLLVSSCWNMKRANPFIKDEIEIGLTSRYNIEDYLIKDELFEDIGFSLIPRHNPSMQRFIHIDLSKSGDATGITMGGVSGMKEYVSRNSFGRQDVGVLAPELFIDFTVSLKAPQGDQIDYEKIQRFINYLRSMGYNIRMVTFDQYQSVMPMQMLKKDGFEVDNISTVKNDLPYLLLRDAFSNKNIDIPFNSILEKELINLIHDTSVGQKGLVDHPKMFSDGSKGRKDIADSVAGVMMACTQVLTDMKKYPYTANPDLAGASLNNIFQPNNPITHMPIYAGKNAPKSIEVTLTDEHVKDVNAFLFKL